MVERAPDVVELAETTLKTRLLIERDVLAVQSRPAESGTELENLRDARRGAPDAAVAEVCSLASWGGPVLLDRRPVLVQDPATRWLSALCWGGGQPSGELAREGGSAGERTFRQLGLCSSYALLRNRDFFKSRGIRLMPAFLGDGLLSVEGDLWLRQRRLRQPASHRERVAAYAETMVALEGR